MASFTTHSVTSKDGTRISYRKFGSGPALVLVQGTMGTAQNFLQFAELLAPNFTVYVPDRRGRGDSGPTGTNYNIQKEVEDLSAVVKATGTHWVFGLSSGAIISLETARTLSTIQKVIIFEPPFFTKENIPMGLVDLYEKEIAAGNVGAALVAGMKAGQFAPPLIAALPNSWLVGMVNMAMRREAKKGSGGYPPMRELAKTLHNDFALVQETYLRTERYSTLNAEILLLGGSKSPGYLKHALTMLQTLLPHATRQELPGVGHAASWNRDRGGKPTVVAEAVRHYLL